MVHPWGRGTVDQNAHCWAELMTLVGLRGDVFAEDEQVDTVLVDCSHEFESALIRRVGSA
jgi:hypothetical protein